MEEKPQIKAVLGPTNTGKTHYAMERMLSYESGIIGLPLRLLAREVYDRMIAQKGTDAVALITGEERIAPKTARYWVCTVEAMPQALNVDFLAVDEIQLCADPERGHVFTNRLLHARGRYETIFMGSDSMRGIISALIQPVRFIKRERYSKLSYTGAKKISRIMPRAAIVAFSIDNLYQIAELLRRQKGGAAVVMGALSPRTRNAQVQMYQEGEVDYLVATDAIGMGLNLDIHHVAFSALKKFDGRHMRTLQPAEMAQIAGRAGRYVRDGTFGVTGEVHELPEEYVSAISENQFPPIKRLFWRNADLHFSTLAALEHSLEQTSTNPVLIRTAHSDDLTALKTLAAQDEVAARASNAASVRLLWDVCSIPDFRDISASEHADLLRVIFCDLHEYGHLRHDWFARQIEQVDKTHGDIDTLSKRLAFIRTWTYVAERSGWLDNQQHWRSVSRDVEDRLSDALHDALTQRFVDRRTSVLMRGLKQKETLVAEVNNQGEVSIQGQYVGQLKGFCFEQDAPLEGSDPKTLRSACLAALAPQYLLRSEQLYNALDTDFELNDQGDVMWHAAAVGRLVAGADPLKPQIKVLVDDEAGPLVSEKVARRLQHFINRKIATLFEPLMAMQTDETLSGLARGLAFQLIQNFGLLDRRSVADEVKRLDQEARGALRKHRVRFGQYTIFMPQLLKPAPTQLRLILWARAQNLTDMHQTPPPGLVSVPCQSVPHEEYHLMCGYRAAGARAIRVDMIERIADLIREQDSRAGFEATNDMLSLSGMTHEQFADLMQGLGYQAVQGNRVKKPALEAAQTQPETQSAQDPLAEEVAEPEIQNAQAPLAEEGAEPETEIYYTFTWPTQPARNAHKKRHSAKKKKPAMGAKTKPAKHNSGFSKANKKEAIDPDNPFVAALSRLKT